MIKDNLTKMLLSAINSNDSKQIDKDDDPEFNGQIRSLISVLLSKAGKSKNDVVQVLGKEIGMALAAMLKDPLRKVAENQQLKITIELTPKKKPKKESPLKKKGKN